MPAIGESRFNRILALFLVGAGSLLLIAFLIFLYLLPEATIREIDKSNIKVTFFFLFLTLIILIGVLVYWIVHTPTVRRLTVVGWRTVVVYSGLVCGFSIFGWPKIKSVSLTQDDGLKAEYDLISASLDAWPNLAICFIGIVLMTLIYVLVGFIEAKLEREL